MTASRKAAFLAAAAIFCAVNVRGDETFVAPRVSGMEAGEAPFTGPRAKALFDGEDSRKPSPEELLGRWSVAARTSEGKRELADLQRAITRFYHFYSVTEIHIANAAGLTATIRSESQEAESPIEWTETTAVFAERRPIPEGVHATSYRFACRAAKGGRLLCKVRSSLPSGLEFTGYLDLKKG